MFRFIFSALGRIPWPVWLISIGALAWFGRNILLIIATIIAFHPIPIPPLFQGEPETLREARLQDLRHFDHVRRNERSMTPDMRTRFDAQLARLEAEAGHSSDAEFQLGLARAQAVIDNGHSNASATRMVEHFPRWPVRMTVLDGEFRVLRVLPGFENLLGARLTAIGDVEAGVAAARFRDAFGGNNANFSTIVPVLLDTPDYLAAVGLDASRARFETQDGAVIEIDLPALASTEGARRTGAETLRLPWRSESADWIAVEPAGDPLRLRRRDHDYWFEEIEPGIVYLALRANFDDESGETISDFARRAEAEIRALAPRAVILDQRANRGGDLTRTHELMDSLGESVGPEGRVYLLASGATFSAAIVNLAAVKATAPDQTVLIGEPIGDRLQFWAEGWWYSLPNSGFRARYSTGYYDLQNGCTGWLRCPWGSLHIFPILVDDLDIDIPAPMDFDAYAAGRDPALEAALAAARTL